jgi:hypothetical protein
MNYAQLLRRCPSGFVPSFAECAKSYSQQWRDLDEGPSKALRSPIVEDQLGSLRQLVNRYKVARNLPRRFDEELGTARLQPLLDAVNATRTVAFGKDDATKIVVSLTGEIASRYGGARLVSLASKVGWFVFGSPIVIYDSLAKDALGVSTSSYMEYYAVWRDLYRDVHDELTDAAEPYSTEEWFVERTFDILLWTVGDRRRKARRTRMAR